MAPPRLVSVLPSDESGKHWVYLTPPRSRQNRVGPTISVQRRPLPTIGGAPNGFPGNVPVCRMCARWVGQNRGKRGQRRRSHDAGTRERRG